MTRAAALVRQLLRRSLAVGAGLLLLAVLGASSGLYNIAASSGHWAVVEWFLAFAMRRSIEIHAIGIVPPPLDDPDLYRLGAGHFHSGCAFCHGAPGLALNPIARAMLPPPPALGAELPAWNDRELFWIVKHGIKYTGMPAWSAPQRDDEVWAVVTFLRRLPALGADDYRALALGDVEVATQSGAERATAGDTSGAETACARCHGSAAGSPASQLVPRLHGQNREFLIAALRAYADGRRPSGIMQPVASDLSSSDLERVADYYARQRPPDGLARTPGDPAAVERGRRLAAEGDAAMGLPACFACHGPGVLPVYPRLDRQNAAYMVNRLRLWKQGVTASHPTAAIMAPIAQRMSDNQMHDVAAYFAAAPVVPELSRP